MFNRFSSLNITMAQNIWWIRIFGYVIHHYLCLSGGLSYHLILPCRIELFSKMWNLARLSLGVKWEIQKTEVRGYMNREENYFSFYLWYQMNRPVYSTSISSFTSWLSYLIIKHISIFSLPFSKNSHSLLCIYNSCLWLLTFLGDSGLKFNWDLE